MTLKLEINPEDEKTFGPCECCGNMTRRVWGYAYDGDVAVAAYFVEWTPGHAQAAANFDLIIGKWGEQARAADRKAVALDFRQLENGPAFRLIDAAQRPVGSNSLVSEALRREQIVDKPIASTVFDICDAILLGDPRIAPLRERNS
jgi:hypothetical protein